MTARRGDHTATLLPNGRVLIAGGFTDFPCTPGALASAELYDAGVGGFTATASMTAARGRHAAALLETGDVLIAGGLGAFCAGPFNSAELFSATAADQRITANGTTISATEGTVFSGTVATFTDPDANSTASEYSATIDWGNGTGTTAGTISGPQGGLLTVSGSHSFSEEASRTITVTITDTDTPTNTATVGTTANVSDAGLSAGGRTINSVNPFSGTVASFTDADQTDTASDSRQDPTDYTATIAWGDGSSSPGVILPNGPGFSVNGSHAYGALGPYTITVDVRDVGGSQSTATTSILVFAFPSGGTSFAIGNGNAAPGTSVTWWGPQWRKANSLSGGTAPSSFKGFVDSTPNQSVCGASWSTDPANRAGPPDSVPSYMAVIVSNSISMSGSTISGNTPAIDIVKTDPGYAPSVGHAGTGSVVAVLCSAA